jgi:hypothetical protein
MASMSGMATRGAAAAFALCLAACSTREAYLGAGAEAGAGAGGDAAQPDARGDAVGDGDLDRPAPIDASVDLGPPCLVGGTSAILPATVACLDATPGRIAVAGDHVYWTVQGNGAVLFRAALAGGAPEPLVFDVAGGFGILTDARFVYYTQPVLGRVMRVPLEGGTATPLATNLDSPWLLATDGANLYWTEGQGGQGMVRKLALTDAVAPDATPVTLMDGLSHPRAIGVHAGFVYWTDLDDGTILRAPDHLLGPPEAGVQTASLLANGLNTPTDLLFLGDLIYLTDWNGHIWRLPLAGGDLEPVADVAGMPYSIATDGKTLYWSVRGDGGGIYTAPATSCAASSCEAKPLVPDQIEPHFVAVTAENIYWSTWLPFPAIHRLAK